MEGFTNPGWTLLMALVHMWQQDQSVTSLFIQVFSLLCLAGVVALTLLVGVSVGTKSFVAATAAAIVTAFYFPLNFFSLMGMETGILALLITASVYCILRNRQNNKAGGVWPWLLMGLAALIRLDASVALIATAIGSTIAFPRAWKTTVLYATVSLFITVGGQTLLRQWYYGEWLPNTYYLKMGEVPLLTRLGRGTFVTGRFLYNHLWPLYLLIPIWFWGYVKNRE